MTSLTLGGGTLETTGSGVFGQPASTVTLNGNISYVNGTGINGTTITGGAHTQIVTGTTLIINGVTLPAGIYPINNGTINLGGSIIKLGGATIVHPAASTPPP